MTHDPRPEGAAPKVQTKKTRPTPVPGPILRGPLALTTFVGFMTEAEREILARQGTAPELHRPQRHTPVTPLPKTEAA